MSDFTVIIPYRPREHYDSFPDLEKVVRSINAPTIISWYGYRDMMQTYILLDHLYIEDVIFTDEKGLFNRSRAINIGVDASETDYVFINDADCMWTGDVKSQLQKAFSEDKHVVYRIKFGDKINDHGAGMQGYRKSWGLTWDEQYEGYGREDIDFLRQAIKPVEYLSGNITHLDHPVNQYPAEWKKNKEKFERKWKT